MKKSKYLFSFTKIQHTLFSIPLVLSGAWLGSNQSIINLKTLLLVVTATFGARIFGMSCNRIIDRNIDNLNPRTAARELPSGKIDLKTAVSIACSGLFIYFISCLFLGNVCFKLSLIPLIPLFFYSFLKRITFLCHFGIGFCLALAPLASFVAASGHTSFTLSVITFSVFVFFWLSGSDIIYSIMDLESDRINEIQSLPARFGASTAQIIAFCTHIASVLFMAITIILLGGNFLSWLFFFVTLIFFSLMYVPVIPLSIRFFPLSSFAGFTGSVASILA